jgi:hypothetical protein
MAWTGSDGEEQTFDWQMTVRRVDLVRVWSTPAELSASVVRRIDIDPASAATLHREGEVGATGQASSTGVVEFAFATQTTSTDPIALLLPVPVVIGYRADIVDPQPVPTNQDWRITSTIFQPHPESGSAGYINVSFVGAHAELDPSSLSSERDVCRVAEACSAMTIESETYRPGRDVSPPVVRVRWSLDVTVFSYSEVPVTLSLGDP